MIKKRVKVKRGFTLVEILVSISIIAILLSLATIAFQQSKASARDGKRRADLEIIRSALEIYRADCGQYPASLTFGADLVGQSGNCTGITYLAEVPDDPIDTKYTYYYSSDGTTYLLCAYLENDPDPASGCAGSCGEQTCNHRVESPR